MFTLEERQKAVDLFIESGLSENTVIRELGYPSPVCLRNWYNEFITTGKLHEKSRPKPKFTEEEIAYAVEYYRTHKLTYTQACRELGYPTRNVLKKWGSNSSLLTSTIFSSANCMEQKKVLRYSPEEKINIVLEWMDSDMPVYKIAAKYNISKATISSWKKQFLGDGIMDKIPSKFVATNDNTLNKADTLPDDPDLLKSEITALKRQVMYLQMECDALEKAAEIAKKQNGINLQKLKNVEKTKVIDALRNSYPLKDLLTLFQLSKSSYFYCRKALNKPDKYEGIRKDIKEIYENNYRCYGYRRIHSYLKATGTILSEKVIRRIMAEEHLYVRQSKHRQYNSYLGEISPAVDNVIARDFKADMPNKKWITDISEFAIPAGKVYLSPIIDCFDGMVVSWTIGTSPNATLVNTMLDCALAKIQAHMRPIIHSDRGAHYRWPGWIMRVENANLTRSMSKKGCSPDNAACEGFFGRLKNEFFYNRSWHNITIEEFCEQLNQYIHWYNEKRIKVSLQGMSPVQYRQSLGIAC